MDLNKTYSNPNLERRRRELIQRNNAEAVLRAHKRLAVDPRADVLAALRGETVGPLGDAILKNQTISRALRAESSNAARRLLLAAAERSNLLDAASYAAYLPAIAHLLEARSQWVREPDTWRPGSYNVGRQFSSLARHLLAQYAVPSYFDAAWLDVSRGAAAHRTWFIHVGLGGNLRKAVGLPIVLTKMMAHHALAAPDGVSVRQAIRYGQLRGMSVAERASRAILASIVGDAFFAADVEAFWATVFNFFVQHPMIDTSQIGPIIDYLHNQKYVPAGVVRVNGNFVNAEIPQPGLSMKGRDPVTLVAQVEAWHRQLARKPKGDDVAWQPSGIAGYDRIEGEEGNQRRFTITELLSSAELRDEGTAMKHCVATYSWSCRSGRVAIFSLKMDDGRGKQRLLTIEVLVKERQIIQARGKYNKPSTALDQRILNAWATVAKLKFGRFALTPAW